MNSTIFLKKEDFKRFKKCFKIAWTLTSRDNLRIVQNWITNKEISVFFDLQNNNNNKINNYFLNKNISDNLIISRLYNTNFETYWPYDENVIINYINNLSNKSKIISADFKIDFYMNEKIVDGIEVEKFAHEYFMQKYNCFNLKYYSKKIAFDKTIEVLKNKKYDIYFEPSFIYNDCITKCDILKKLPDGTYHLIEIKSSTGRKYNYYNKVYFSNNIKDEYAYDIAYQYYVLTGVNLIISKISLMFLNSKYYRNENIDYDKLFIFQEFYKLKTKTLPAISLLEFCKQIMVGKFSKCISKNNNIIDDLSLIKNYFKQSKEVILKLFKKGQCFNGKGDRYGYCQHVTSYLPSHHSVFELTRGMEKKTLLKYQENINLLKEIVFPFSFKQLTNKKKRILFSNKQQRQILAVKNKISIIDPCKITIINKLLKEYKYPIYMYDFETMKSAIPKFKYSYPYQQIPFQYSVHVIKDEFFNYYDKNTLEHYSFLADGECDPRLLLIKNLVITLFTKKTGVYVAYYKSFECKILRELINYLEILIKKTINKKSIITYLIWQQKLNIILKKTIDLMDFFKDFMIYKKEFYGSTSIKIVQPAFDNKFTYETLNIQKGNIASQIFRSRVENNISIVIWKKIFRTEMLKYCNRDTLSMVIIFQHIIKLVKKYKEVEEKKWKNIK